MTVLAGMDVERHLADPTLKQRYVTAMFDLIAPRYDDFTRAFSFGMDRWWKRGLVRRATARFAGPVRVIDLACGTGDLAAAVARALPISRICGIDASPAMVERARARHRGDAGLRFEHGDMMHLAMAEGSVDLVTVGYGLRNVPDHRAALVEIARVLRPGGRLAVLDFARPALPPWRWCYLGYLAVAGRAYGWWWHRDPAVYGYIARSIEHFVSARRLAADCAAAGFRVLELRRWLLGGMVELQAERR